MDRPKVFENGWIHISPNFPDQVRIVVGSAPDHENIQATLYHYDPFFFDSCGRRLFVSGQEIVDYVHGFKIPVTWVMEYLEET